jgi:AcrR family transcriptional regulator
MPAGDPKQRIRNPGARRADLLGAAAGLFAEVGYDRATIDQIIGRAKTSKGGFYHHFQSKEDLLEALAGEAAAQALVGLETILGVPRLTAAERLNLFLRRGRQDTDSNRDIATYGAIFRPENLALYHRLHRAVTRVLVDPLAEIIEQGRREGIMRCDHPRITAEIILMLGPATHDVLAAVLAADTPEAFESAMAEFRLRLELQALAVDRILGLPDGTVSYWDDDFGAKWTFHPK